MEVSTPDDDASRPTENGSSAVAAVQTGLPVPAADKFHAAAAREHQEGHVDAVIWARALAQAGADESLAIPAYLRARATALRLEQRDRRAERRAKRALSMQGTNDSKADAEAYPETASATAAGVRLGGAQPKWMYAAMAAFALASVVAVVWLVSPPHESASAGPPSVSVATPSSERSSPAKPVESAQPAAGSASGSATSQDDAVASIETMVLQLKDAGNWNVLVLYASEWTRKQPNNAAAWNELSIGFANLRQFNDALGAAEKAAALSPQDARLWRNLGQLNLNLERLPEAGSAFDKVLALNAEDADALCGAALAAHKLGPTKGADAIARRAKAAAAGCPGLSDGESVTVVAREVAPRKPASAIGH